MRLAWLAGLALFALAAVTARADEWTHQYAVKGKPELHVRTDDGAVRVETGTTGTVDARVTTEGWRIAPGEVTVTESQTGDRVDLEVTIPKGHSGTGKRSVEVLLRVPKESDLDVTTGDGSIKSQPVSGRLSLSTADGSINADGLRGEIRLRSGDGSIRAAGLAGRLNAETGDGSMTVGGRFEILDLRTGDGSIDATAETGSKVDSPWSLHSGNGSITLHVPDGLGAELDAETGGGSIHLANPAMVKGSIREHAVRGTLGPGGPPLKIYTGDGSIRLSGQ